MSTFLAGNLTADQIGRTVSWPGDGDLSVGGILVRVEHAKTGRPSRLNTVISYVTAVSGYRSRRQATLSADTQVWVTS